MADKSVFVGHRRGTAPLATASAAAIAGGLACWLLGLVGAGSWAALHRPDPLPDDAIALLAAVTGLLLCGWWTLGATITALATLADGGAHGAGLLARAARTITPGVLHRAVILGLGVSLAAGGSAADAAGLGDPRPDPRVTLLSGVADRRPATGDPVDPGWGAAASGAASVVVRRGDTLWALAERALKERALAERTAAERTLAERTAAERTVAERAAIAEQGRTGGRRPTNAQIAQAWPGWFTANRAVIGTDPDHLEPGQHLVPPT